MDFALVPWLELGGGFLGAGPNWSCMKLVGKELVGLKSPKHFFSILRVRFYFFHSPLHRFFFSMDHFLVSKAQLSYLGKDIPNGRFLDVFWFSIFRTLI